MQKTALFIILFLISFPAFTKNTEIDTKKLLERIDEMFRSKGSSSTIEMEIISPDFERKLKMKSWSKGMDYTFITIKSPRKDKGVSTLKRKNEMWNYFPKINKVIKVPPSMMMGSWMGSDFSNDDLVKEEKLSEDYVSKSAKKKAGEIELTLTPKAGTVSLWGKIEILIDEKSLLPKSQSFYDEKGKKVRLMNFKEIKELGGKVIPTVMEVIPLTKKGKKTIVRYLDAKFDIEVKDSIFTRINLQKRR